MLKWRFATALVLLPLVLGAVFFLPTGGFALAAAVVVALAAWEWTRLIGIASLRDRRLHVFALLVLMAGSALLLADAVGAAVILTLGALAWVVLAFWLLRFERGLTADTAVTGATAGAVGLLLFVPAWFALVWLHARPDGAWMLLTVFVLTWAADVGAYFAGRAFGRRRLAPRTSPGKTLEGAAGGLILTLAAAGLLAAYFPVALPGGATLVMLALLTFVASVLGDLVESMIKRRCGVKDSGALLPGHGGILDRIDSLTATAPVFATGLLWL